MRAEGTAVQRLREARRNAELVIAEAALQGERRASIARITMFALFTFAHEVVGRYYDSTLVRDPVRGLAGLLYVGAAVATFLILRRVKPNPRGAMVWPTIHTVIDCVFVSFMGMRTFQTDHTIHPEMGAIAFALVISFSVARAGVWQVVVATLLASASFVSIAVYTGAWHPIGGTFVLGGFVALGLLIALTNHSVHAMFRGLRSRDNLSRFLPRQLVERVIALGDAALQPVQSEVTVLFSDLRDFTSLSESMPPRELLELLDEYFGHMSQIVKAHDGIVNKFIGDGMLAFWNVPERNPAHAELALRAALDMRRRLEELNATRANKGLPSLRFGIGIHSGSVAAGMLGGADQHEYTVIGDAVNLASRIEGLNKALGTDILVSDATMRHVGARFQARAIGDQRVKGRTEAVGVHALEGLRAAA